MAYRRSGFPVTLASQRTWLTVALACVALSACKKAPAEAHPAGAAAPALAVPAGAAVAAPSGTGAEAQAAPPAGKEDTVAPPGLDLSRLDDFEKRVFFRIVNKEGSVCGAPHSMLHSAKNDRACTRAIYALRYVARQVDAGYTDSEIVEAITKRYKGGPAKNIDVNDAPSKGPAGARVTIVEFVDYECPHCKRVQPVLRQILDEYRNDVRVVFKHYPLAQHEHARLAAEAAVAAHRQGKFWPFDEKLWANQDALNPADLEKYAKEAGLDVERWRRDLADASVKGRVDRDRSDGQALELESTPALYINGRVYTDAREVEALREAINEELGR